MTERWWCAKGFFREAFFFVAAPAYSQLLCGLLGKYLLSESNNAHIIRRVFFDYNFQWMNLASQFESCTAVCSRSSWALRFLGHILQGRVATRLRCDGSLIISWLSLYCSVIQWNNFENRLRYDGVTAMNFGGLLFWNTVYAEAKYNKSHKAWSKEDIFIALYASSLRRSHMGVLTRGHTSALSATHTCTHRWGMHAFTASCGVLPHLGQYSCPMQLTVKGCLVRCRTRSFDRSYIVWKKWMTLKTADYYVA